MGAPIRVLHVDDDPAMTSVTADLLERHDDGLAVVSKTTPSEALSYFLSEPVDCIVSDYQMPEMNGLELLETVRVEHDSDVPFVVFTGKGREEVAVEALNLGANRYIQKGGDPEAQYDVLASAIRQEVEHYRDAVARRETEQRYRSLFENYPLVTWEEDFSDSIEYLETLCEEVDDLEAHLDDNLDEVERLFERIDIIDVNENALEYYGVDSKEELFEHFDELFPEEVLREAKQIWVGIAEGRTQMRWEQTAATLDGETTHEIVEMNVPEQYADDYSRVYLTAMDVTERKERERQLERQNERLDEFATLVSHDLRNPLTVAKNRLALARRDCESQHHDHVDDALDQMDALIDDLLVLAREGDVDDPAPVALEPLVHSAWRNLDAPDADLVVDTSRTVVADETNLRQVFENLFRNSLEHGSTSGQTEADEHAADASEDDSGVTVTVGTFADGDDPTGFFVADDGPGIPPADRAQVLEPGYSTGDGGTGFGLHIVEEIVTAHGWTLDVTESEAGGARFEITGVEFA